MCGLPLDYFGPQRPFAAVFYYSHHKSSPIHHCQLQTENVGGRDKTAIMCTKQYDWINVCNVKSFSLWKKICSSSQTMPLKWCFNNFVFVNYRIIQQTVWIVSVCSLTLPCCMVAHWASAVPVLTDNAPKPKQVSQSYTLRKLYLTPGETNITQPRFHSCLFYLLYYKHSFVNDMLKLLLYMYFRSFNLFVFSNLNTFKVLGNEDRNPVYKCVSRLRQTR